MTSADKAGKARAIDGTETTRLAGRGVGQDQDHQRRGDQGHGRREGPVRWDQQHTQADGDGRTDRVAAELQTLVVAGDQGIAIVAAHQGQGHGPDEHGEQPAGRPIGLAVGQGDEVIGQERHQERRQAARPGCEGQRRAQESAACPCPGPTAVRQIAGSRL